MAAEYCAMADGGGGADMLPQVSEDRLSRSAGPSQELLAIGGVACAPASLRRHGGLQVVHVFLYASRRSVANLG